MRAAEFNQRAKMPTGVAAYIDRQNFRKYTPGRIDEFGNYWRFVDGVKISDKEFNAMYPPLKPIKTQYYKGVAIGQKIPD